jgi:IclR family KDG regulon transcriptional repressor
LEVPLLRRPKSDYVIQTVANAVRLLEAFHDAEYLGVTELSRRLSLHKNNVFRLLATLEQSGFVEQCDDERYRLGVGALALSHAFLQNCDVSRLARPVLQKLSAETGESAHLGVLTGFEVFHLDGEQPDQLVVTALRTGRKLSAHCTALGKAILASGDPGHWEQIDRDYLQAGALQAETPTTITDREKFVEHLRETSSKGYALDLEECEPGMCCAAAAVHDARGSVVGALSVSAPSFRSGEQALVEQAVPRLVGAARELSRRLGYMVA